MSQSIAPADLSAAAVGSKGNLDWSGLGLPSAGGKPARILLYNESGCGLVCRLRGSGRTFEIPAGGWFQDPLELLPNETGIDFTVRYVMPNQPVSLLIGTYYGPGEQGVSVSLGNSPIGLSGSVSTTNTQVVNDGNPSGSNVVEATEATNTGGSNVSLDNQGNLTLSEWGIGGILNQLLKVAAGIGVGGDVVQLGKAGVANWTHVLNQFKVDAQSSLDGGKITTDGAGDFSAVKLIAAPQAVGNGTPALLDLKPGGATVNKEWIILYNGATGGIQFYNVTDSINAFSITAAGGLAVSQSLSVAAALALTQALNSFAGTTAGTCYWSEVLTGTSLKVFIAFVTGYRNSTATSQRITLPTPFTYGGIMVNIGAGSNWAPKDASIVDISFSETTLGTGTGAGSQASRTGVPFSTIGHVSGAVTYIDLPNSMGAAVTGWVALIGF